MLTLIIVGNSIDKPSSKIKPTMMIKDKITDLIFRLKKKHY